MAETMASATVAGRGRTVRSRVPFRLAERPLREAARAITSVWAVLLVELIVVAMLGHRGMASIWELQWGTLWLAPTALGLGALLAIVGAGLVALACHGDRPAARLMLAVAVGGFGAAVAWGVGGGRHLSTMVARGGFSLGVAGTAGILTWVGARYFPRWVSGRPLQVAALVATTVLVTEVVNHFVLVRLYPAFHLGLAMAAVLVAPAATAAVSVQDAPAKRRPGHAWRVAVGVVAAITLGALILARPAAAQLTYFDNFRLFLLNQAPMGSLAVRVAAWLAPPPPIKDVDDSCLAFGGCRDAQGQGSLDLRGRDLLFVTIDAVRADHVGAYGYDRPTTPHLDRLAAEGVRFDSAYCATPHTSYSITSMMTGKYMRPLLLQGAGSDSDTWAGLLRRYGYRTAGFYPPAVFFIDERLFTGFRRRHLDFEYRKSEFLEGDARVAQVRRFLDGESPDHPLFVWVHLFGPHEPYEAHPRHPFGRRDVDRYDSEIAAADETVGKLVKLFRERRPGAVVIVSADHGEEFGDHGGRYHGTTVYEEQVRVPLVVNAPGLLEPRSIKEPVQTIDLLPTVLAALRIPRPPRIRGRDLGDLMTGSRKEGQGRALAETEEYVMLAEGTFRLICARKVGACQLYDVRTDPGQHKNVASEHSERMLEMRRRLQELSSSHGRYEERGLRAEGKVEWPAAILRGVAGDGDAAEDIAALLDDADREIRRKAAEVLFNLNRASTAEALRLALSRDEDAVVRKWCALTLTRIGQGAPLVNEVLEKGDLRWRRLAALALAESGDARGEPLLVDWWMNDSQRDYERSRELLNAFAKIRSKDAVWPLVQSLGDVRLRPYIASTLATIDEEVARGPLARALADERYQGARIAIAKALVQLGAKGELAGPLIRFLGVPDPLQGGVGFALQADILAMIGGPDRDDLRDLVAHAPIGAQVVVAVPKGGNGTGVRVVVRARNTGSQPASVHVGGRADPLEYDSKGMVKNLKRIPKIDLDRSVGLVVPPGGGVTEVHGPLPESLGARPGRAQRLVVYAERGIEVLGMAVVPLADELPPPAPQPWHPEEQPGDRPPQQAEERERQ